MNRTYATEIPVPRSEHGMYEGLVTCVGSCLGFIGIVPGCCCFPYPFKQVNQGQVGLVSKFGKYYKTVDSGLYQIK